MTGRVRILLSSASNSSSHFFSRLVDGQIDMAGDNGTGGIKSMWIPFEANPANTPEYLNILRTQNPIEVIEQEVFGHRGSVGGKIITNFSSDSYQDKEAKFYTKESPIIEDLLQRNGKLFIAFDGGTNAKKSACVIGWYVETEEIIVILKEIFSENTTEPIEVLAKRASIYANRYFSNKEIELVGDPSLVNYGDNATIEEIFDGDRLSLLDRIRNSVDERMQSVFKNRKGHRINMLRQVIQEWAISMNLPRVLILAGTQEKTFNPNSHGAYYTYTGLFEGGYQYKSTPHGFTDDIEQNTQAHSCDALSYFILDTYASMYATKSAKSNKNFGRFSRY
jgi:hypothetical protein